MNAERSAKITKQVRDAVNELLKRVRQRDDHKIVDDKEDIQGFEPFGVLQDCEFGFILLLARDWLKSRDALGTIDTDPIADEANVQSLVIEIVRRVLELLTSRVQFREQGGQMKDALTFFSGAPYTWVLNREFKPIYSANLDAAVITLSFLMLVLQTYDAELQLTPPPSAFSKSPKSKWVASLRDAALFVCEESLAYVQQCRVVTPEGEFLGFTCDPSSREPSGDQKKFPDNRSRLFFTWTACESIADAVKWRNSYLAALGANPQDHHISEELINKLIERINDIEPALRQSSEWCYQEFYEQFNNLGNADVAEFVKRTSQEESSLSSDLEAERDRIATYVQNVYRISQYIAIRSLVPGVVGIAEAERMMDQLHRLVSQKIIGSGLDASTNPEVGKALTCSYSLARSNDTPYRDDAYYPLVVRSLSGLLTRTIEDFQQREPDRLRDLALAFHRTLADHYDYLVQRVPEGDENKALWSFAPKCKYVFYATQRTLFALLFYADFLDATGPVIAKRSEVTPVAALGQALLEKLVEQPLRGLLLEILAPGSPNDGIVQITNEPWANEVIRTWLRTFATQQGDAQVFPTIKDGATILCSCRAYLNGEIEVKIENRKKKLQNLYETIFELPAVGKKLKKLTDSEWVEPTLLTVLLEHLFAEYLNQAEKNVGALLESKDTQSLWRCIRMIQKWKENEDEQDNLTPLPR